MPLRKTYRPRRPRRLRRYVRRYRKKVYRKPRMLRSVGPLPFFKTKMNYTAINAFTLATATTVSYIFRLNSLYDPDYSGAGGQPYYHDQFSLLYKYYRVYGCKVTVKISSSCNTNNVFHPTVSLMAADQPTGPPSIQQVINSRKSMFRNLVTNQPAAVFSRYYSIADVMGVPKSVVANDDRYNASTGADPNNVAYLFVHFCNNDTASPVNFTYEVKLTYYTRYYGLLYPSAS